MPVAPSPRTLTGCPVPTAPPAGQSVPRVQTPLSDPRGPRPLSRAVQESPRSAEGPSEPRPGARAAAVPALGGDKKDKKPGAPAGREDNKKGKSSRRRATNGWLPLGLSYQKEVFTVVRTGFIEWRVRL